MSASTRLHRRINRLSRRRGEAVTFTHVEKTISETTGLPTGTTTTTVSGHAVRMSQLTGDAAVAFQGLGLVQGSTPILQFSPATISDEPKLLSTCVLGGVTYSVKFVWPVVLDGDGVAYIVAVGR